MSTGIVDFPNPIVLIRLPSSYMAHSAVRCRPREDILSHCTWMSSRFSRVLSEGPSTKHITGSALVGEKPEWWFCGVLQLCYFVVRMPRVKDWWRQSVINAGDFWYVWNGYIGVFWIGLIIYWVKRSCIIPCIRNHRPRVCCGVWTLKFNVVEFVKF